MIPAGVLLRLIDAQFMPARNWRRIGLSSRKGLQIAEQNAKQRGKLTLVSYPELSMTTPGTQGIHFTNLTPVWR